MTGKLVPEHLNFICKPSQPATGGKKLPKNGCLPLNSPLKPLLEWTPNHQTTPTLMELYFLRWQIMPVRTRTRCPTGVPSLQFILRGVNIADVGWFSSHIVRPWFLLLGMSRPAVQAVRGIFVREYQWWEGHVVNLPFKYPRILFAVGPNTD